VDERDLQTLFETPWEIRDEVRAIRVMLEEDNDGEGEDPKDDR